MVLKRTVTADLVSKAGTPGSLNRVVFAATIYRKRWLHFRLMAKAKRLGGEEVHLSSKFFF